MKRVRNLTFLLFSILVLTTFRAAPRAEYGPGYHCWDYGWGLYYCYFGNDEGERSCNDMVTVCHDFCDNAFPGNCTYLDTQCYDDGGDPPNHGACIYFVDNGGE
jgi:hypothetical protein